MDSDGSTLLRQPDDMLFHFFATGHHQVGYLIGDDHDEGHLLRKRIPFLVGFRMHTVPKFVVAQLVVGRHVPDTRTRQEPVSFLHFVDGPCQNGLGLPHVGHDRVHQVGQLLIGTQLDHLRVDHQHPHFVGTPGHEHRGDDRVEADALAGAGTTGNEQVR